MHSWKEITQAEYYNIDEAIKTISGRMKYFICINCQTQCKDFSDGLGNVFQNDYNLYFKDISHLTCEEIIIKRIIE